MLFCVCVCGVCRCTHPCMYTWRQETRVKSLYLMFFQTGSLTEFGAPWLASRPPGCSLPLASHHREYRCALDSSASPCACTASPVISAFSLNIEENACFTLLSAAESSEEGLGPRVGCTMLVASVVTVLGFCGSFLALAELCCVAFVL